MPDATASLDTVTKQLKTCEGAYVELKTLPYGKMLHRRDNASRMSMEQKVNRGRGRVRQEAQEDTKVSIETMQMWTRWYEFKECIVDHNLEDKNGRKLDFNSKMDFQLLDPKVGAEIERYIDEMNQDEEDEEDEDFSIVSGEPLTPQEMPQLTTSNSEKK